MLPVIKECPALRRQGSAGRAWLASVLLASPLSEILLHGSLPRGKKQSRARMHGLDCSFPLMKLCGADMAAMSPCFGAGKPSNMEKRS